MAPPHDQSSHPQPKPAPGSSPDAAAPPLLDPKLDVVFKMMFGREQNRDVLISLLTAVLRPAQPIVEVTVENAEVPHTELADKDVLLDLVVRLADGSVVDVEMQTESRLGAMTRALYYWARLASPELHRGQSYPELPRVAVVLLLGYRAMRSAPFHGVFQVRERTTGTLLSDRLEIHLVELPRLKELDSAERAAEERLALWASFFNARDRHELEELAMMDPIMERAKSILEELSADPSAQEAARQRELGLLNWSHERYLVREEALREGREQGLEKGEAIGIEKGVRRGIVAVLEAKGIALDDAQRQRLSACSDLSTLERWLAQAAVARTAAEALAG